MIKIMINHHPPVVAHHFPPMSSSFEARRLQDAVHAHHLRAALRAGGRRWQGAHADVFWVNGGMVGKRHIDISHSSWIFMVLFTIVFFRLIYGFHHGFSS